MGGRPVPERADSQVEGRGEDVSATSGQAPDIKLLPTEASLEAGLAWLAAHQDGSGAWSAVGFEEQCPSDDRCGGVGHLSEEMDSKPAMTGLVIMALAAAGHASPEARYNTHLLRALRFLLEQQRPNGGFSAPNLLQTYTDAIATLALADLKARQFPIDLAKPLERSVRHLISAQQRGGGWDYMDDPSSQRSDMSVTAWVLMALHAAQTAGAAVPSECVRKAARFVELMTEADGQVRYADVRKKRDSGAPPWEAPGEQSPAITAAGMYSRFLLGWRNTAPQVVKQAGVLLADPPSAARLQRDPTGLHSEYYWYYGSMAMSRMDRARRSRWDESLASAILGMQSREVHEKGAPRHVYGSWPGYGTGWGRWGRVGGRVYATALAILTLRARRPADRPEQFGEDLLTAGALREGLLRDEEADRERLIRIATQLRAEISEPILADALLDKNERIQLMAALGLADLDSPLGRDVLAAQRDRLRGEAHMRVEETLRRIEAMPTNARCGSVTLYDAHAQLLVFQTGSTPVYYGALLNIRRDQELVAVAKVQRRFDGSPRAVASVVSLEPGYEDIEIGDEVVLVGAKSP